MVVGFGAISRHGIIRVAGMIAVVAPVVFLAACSQPAPPQPVPVMVQPAPPPPPLAIPPARG